MEEQVEHLAAPPSDGAAAVLALIERVVLDPDADAAKGTHRRCVPAAQGERGRACIQPGEGPDLEKPAGIKLVKNRPTLYEIYDIDKGKSQKRTHEAFKYAPLEEIDKHLRPLLLEEEMDLS
jgi:hypothetical protein